MTYEDFCASYRSAESNARRLYQAEAKGTQLMVNGMDDDCMAFIMSPDYVQRDAEATAANAVAEVESDFATP